MMERTLSQALENARRLREELPRLIQPSASDHYMVLLEEEITKLRTFVKDVFKLSDWPDGGDIDMFDFQDCAERHQLLIPHEVTEPCNVGKEEELSCFCAEFGDFPQTCYRMVDWLKD